MNDLIFEFIKRFLTGVIPVDVFVESYMYMWRIQRDLGCLKDYDENKSRFLFSLFMAADNYNSSEDDRMEGEFDEAELRQQVKDYLEEYGVVL